MRLPNWSQAARSRLREPWIVLGLLLAGQWLALLVFALAVRHNGWLFHQPAEGTYYYTTSWLFSDWRLPTTPIGYGWPYLLSPVALFGGPNLLAGLPAIVLVQTVLLLPVALLCVYGIAARIGGRIVGYWTAALWVFVPYALIPFWDDRYHRVYVEFFLPQALGLTAMPEFPSTVCLLLAAYLVLRGLETRDLRVAALGGLAAGFAVALEPSNGIFLAAPLAAFLLARRWQLLLGFAAAVLPALLTIAVWKHRGVGETPPLALAAGIVAAPPTATIFDSITRYVDLDVEWRMLHHNLDLLREFFGSVRFLEYLPIAGALAVARRSLPRAALVALWFAAFFFIKGASPDARVEDGSFLQTMMPAFPAYLLLVASIPLLLPTLGPRLAERFPAPESNSPPWGKLLGGAAVVFAVVPFALVLGLDEMRRPAAVRAPGEQALVPLDHGFRLSATTIEGSKQQLTWRPRGGAGAAVFYEVYRSPAAGQGLACAAVGPPLECRLAMESVGVAAKPLFVDDPAPGKWIYRVGLGANWLADSGSGGLLALSRPVSVAVPR